MVSRKLISKILGFVLIGSSISILAPESASAAVTWTQASNITLGSSSASTSPGTEVSTTVSLVGLQASGAGLTTTIVETYTSGTSGSATVGFRANVETYTAGSYSQDTLTNSTIYETITTTGAIESTTANTHSRIVGLLYFKPDRVGVYTVMLCNNAHCATFTVTSTKSSAVNAAISPVNFNYKTMYDTTNGYQVVGGQATVEIGVDSTTTSTVTISGVGSIVSASDTNTVNAGYETITGLTSTQFNIGENLRLSYSEYETVTVVLNSAVAGTTTISVVSLDANGVPNSAVTKTVTWTSAGSTAAASWATYLIDTSTAPGNMVPADSSVPLSKSKGTSVANVALLKAKLKDANGNAVANATVYATVSGPGLISIGTLSGTDGSGSISNVTGSSRVATTTTTSTGWVYVQIANDLSAGVGTITLTSGTVSASRSITFTGGAATLTAVAGTGTYRVGVNPINGYDVGSVSEDSSTGYAFKVKGVDSAGNLVKSGTVYAKSSNTAVATVSTVAHDFATNANGYVYFLVTGVAAGKATITVQDTNPAGSTAPTASTTIDIQVTTGGANKIALSLDKSSYAPGEPGTLSVTLTNATGDPVADGTYTIFAAATPLLSNLNTTGYATGPNATAWATGKVSVTTSGGVAAYDFYAPTNSGTLTFSGTTLAATTVSSDVTQAARAQAVTVSASVTGDSSASLALDAANAATDAANNAYDEAQNATQAAQDALAAVTALADQVKSLIASVKSLTATFAKIKAKIHA